MEISANETLQIAALCTGLGLVIGGFLICSRQLFLKIENFFLERKLVRLERSIDLLKVEELSLQERNSFLEGRINALEVSLSYCEREPIEFVERGSNENCASNDLNNHKKVIH